MPASLLRVLRGEIESCDARVLPRACPAVGDRLRALRIGLLCLDGCEGVIDAVREQVVGWLQIAPHTSFLVTSRVALGVEHEHIVDLAGLPEDAAITLLVDRGTRRRASFADSPRPVLARICKSSFTIGGL